ncbi:S-adenosyl-L-methionine-dependent methyltransferase [Alternaria alternata]|nr:S-adenosyl-L-methionine-dependent methyltransferase [Alternaria alternata]
MEQLSSSNITLIVPKQHVKTVKQALERAGQLDRSSKITPESPNKKEHTSPRNVGPSSSSQQTQFPELCSDAIGGRYIYPESFQDDFQLEDQIRTYQSSSHTTTTLCDSSDRVSGSKEQQRIVLQDLGLSALSQDVSISHDAPVTTLAPRRTNRNPVHKALEESLTSFLGLLPSSQALTVEALVSNFPEGYSVYSPMLLLPHNAFSSAPWKSLIATHSVNSDAMISLWQSMAKAVGATHVAINSPIPLSTRTTVASSAEMTNSENILRSPVNLTPLYGDFGSTPTPQTISNPTATDFANALWVTARQNGIWQTWAPLYTMFSRGNVREKARILNLPTLTTGLDTASAAVDLYAGIGYFAFSYRKSSQALEKGIKQVLCWEINSWSVEGLRRGAEMNKWTCRVLKQEDILRLRQRGQPDHSDLDDADFVVLETSNEAADLDYPSLRSPRLPVRHVNLGLLPSSKLSWRVAVAMLDTKRQGWIHVHENVNVKDVESMKNEVEKTFQDLLYTIDGGLERRVCVVHVERVKMYAPGVVHCVFDVCVG